MRNSKTNGFTLIELLIVIAIIGILAAVLIPNLMNAREQAAERAAQSHSRNVYTSLVAALSEDSALTAQTVLDAVSGTAGAGDVSCMTADTVGSYGFNDAPGGVVSCTMNPAAGSTSDFTVAVGFGGTAGSPDVVYTNGQEP